MLNLSELGSRVVAAVSSVTLSVCVFAYAIVPAEQAVIFSGAIA
ncbi:hypothetical protein QWY75_01415 [Pontixanthobacter aestiaquae]|nr:hypothetical protein [Pontixanthobacter aestiaquae]MDN3644859.1 hypothetical protein [Pontixanthobacter aestiaquae]